MKAELNYWDIVSETRQYESGGLYRHEESKIIRQETIEANTEIGLFEAFYKLNNRLRYCNGSYYKWVDIVWEKKYAEWLKSDDYKTKSFNLYYGGGVVD